MTTAAAPILVVRRAGRALAAARTDRRDGLRPAPGPSHAVTAPAHGRCVPRWRRPRAELQRAARGAPPRAAAAGVRAAAPCSPPGWSAPGSLLADPEPGVAKAAEWLLDNDYLVARARPADRRGSAEGVLRAPPEPRGGADAGLPRVLSIAPRLLRASRLQLSLPTVSAIRRRVPRARAAHDRRAVGPADDAAPRLPRAAGRRVRAARCRSSRPPFAPTTLAAASRSRTPSASARALANLGVIAVDPLEGLLRADQSRRGDPARGSRRASTRRMDFETRDRYRRAVEELARRSPAFRAGGRRAGRRHARRRRPDGACGRRTSATGWSARAAKRSSGPSATARRSDDASSRWLLSPRRAALRDGAHRRGGGRAWPCPRSISPAAGRGPLGVADRDRRSLCSRRPSLGITLVHWLVTLLVPPRVLPKLDFEKGIPDECRTAVVMPTLVGDVARTRGGSLERLELHYLANPDPAFAVRPPERSPRRAAPSRCPADEAVVRRAGRRDPPAQLDGATEGREPVPRPAPPAALQRRRGLLDGLGAQAREARGVQPSARGRASDGASRCTRATAPALARRALRRHARRGHGPAARRRGPPRRGSLAHPLNRAEFDETTGRVRSGYTVVQPRVEISPESGNRSRFARLFAGDTAIDIYTPRRLRRVSGPLRLRHLRRQGHLRRRALPAQPRRAACRRTRSRATISSRASTVAPRSRPTSCSTRTSRSGYAEFARRWHRWVRGDWQLLPWLARRVPGPAGRALPNRLSADRSMEDRRQPSPEPAAAGARSRCWRRAGSSLPGSPLGVDGSRRAGARPPTSSRTSSPASRAGGGAARCGARRRDARGPGRPLAAARSCSSPHDAAVALDAIARTLVRLFVTRRHLLQWTSGGPVRPRARGAELARAASGGEMWVAPAAAVALGARDRRRAAARGAAQRRAAARCSGSPRPRSRAARPSRPPRPRRSRSSADDRAFLRRLARRTWLFFETFVGPDDQWLPPDNFQEEPRGEVAHRTSPTNIGMMLLSSLAACDLGYLGLPELAVAAAQQPRHARAPRALPRPSVQLVRHANARAARAALRVDGRQRQPRRESAGARRRAASSSPPGRRCGRSAWDGLADVLERCSRALAAPGLGAARDASAARARRTRSSAGSWPRADDPARVVADAARALRSRVLPELDRDCWSQAARDPPARARGAARGPHLARARAPSRCAAWIGSSSRSLPWLALLDAAAAGLRGAVAPESPRCCRRRCRLAETADALRARARARGLAAARRGDDAAARLADGALDAALEQGSGGRRGCASRCSRSPRGPKRWPSAMDFRLALRRGPAALPHRLQRERRPARPASLRPAGLGGAARELLRDREGRRAGRALVPPRAPDDARRAAACARSRGAARCSST